MNIYFYSYSIDIVVLMLIIAFSGLLLYNTFFPFHKIVENFKNKKQKIKHKGDKEEKKAAVLEKQQKINDISAKRQEKNDNKKVSLPKPCDMNSMINKMFLDEVETITKKIKGQSNATINTASINQKALENSQRAAQQNLENALNDIGENYLDASEFVVNDEPVE